MVVQLATRVDDDQAEEFRETTKKLGLSTADALRMFVSSFNEYQGFPYQVRVRQVAEPFENEREASDFANDLSLMRRGEIWTVLADGYARKPRPVVVVQNDEIEGFDSTVVCLMISFTSDDMTTRMTTRVKVPPTAQNGLIKISWVMTEKILAVHTSALGQRIGILEDDVMRQVEKKLADVLAL